MFDTTLLVTIWKASSMSVVFHTPVEFGPRIMYCRGRKIGRWSG
jgi:hypothetical protein